MKILMAFVVFMVVSLHFESLSSQSHKPHSSDVEQIIVQSFKTKILKELGLSSAPKMSDTKAIKIPAIFKQLVEAQNRKFDQPMEEEDEFSAKTKRIFLFPEQVTDVADIAGKNYAFKSNSRHSNLEIKSATFWFHITESPKSAGKVDHEPHQLSLYKTVKAPGKVVHTRELLHSETLSSTGWYSAHVSAVVKEWFSMQRKLNLSLVVAIRGSTSLEVDGVDDESSKQWRPFLVVDIADKKQFNNRKRRNPRANDKQPCSRHNLMVTFRDIGLGFIAFPESLDIRACAGSCVSLAFYRYQLRRFGTLLGKLPDSHICCVPSKMVPASVLLLDDNANMEFKVIQNMRVASCSCAL